MDESRSPDGAWSTTDRHDARSSIQNPFEQARDACHALRRHLATHVGSIDVEYLVAFPDVVIDKSIGLDGDRRLMIDRDDLSDIEARLTSAIKLWRRRARKRGDEGWIERVVALLAPTVELSLPLRLAVKDATKGLTEPTERQLDALRLLQQVPRAVIIGPAGTGKTVLAIERARQLAAQKKRVLVLCYNVPLARHIQEALRGERGVTPSTFHSLCSSTLHTLGIAAPQVGPTWAEEASELLKAARLPRGFVPFDAVLVDEAQDFASTWLDGVRVLLRDPDESPMWLFADPGQRIYPHGSPLPSTWPTITLSMNCRNSRPIAVALSRLGKCSVETLHPGGPEPRFISTDATGKPLRTNGAIDAATRAAVRNILDRERVGAEQVVVLCNSRSHADRLASRSGSADQLDPGVLVETVHSFKGLERDVVIYPFESRIGDRSALRTFAYVGMSRARAMLVIVGPAQLRRVLRWPEPQPCASDRTDGVQL